jgi:membrane-associated phospholipid phosphatase
MSSRRRVNAAACASLLAVALATAPTAAQQGPPPKSRGPEVRYTVWLDLTVTGVALGWWLGSELARDELAPTTCRWCETSGFDTSVRNQLRWQNTGAADTASYALAVAQPVMIFTLDMIAAGKDGQPNDGWIDTLLISEATAVAMAVNQIVKFAVGRERPFVHVLPDADKPFTSRPSDNNLSFYSAHTSLTFALATSAGTLASMRRYHLAPLIWTAGIAVATITGYLRIAADRHYASDVVVGAVVGSLTGAAVPYFFHGPRQVSIAPAPAAGGLSLLVHGVF